MTRRHLLQAGAAVVAAPLLTACGFQLRQAPQFAFKNIVLAMPATGL